ncbi:unnamed protein product [Ambrosiozyma monospora]|uniref:Unnamed protein product n=1 Tax=Ambrosiozyma monospora TaxID=43982 RepID=A0ACB5T0E8_AMBMO|nr:unnamed protein product [Ambrosiozyma monospora]
MSYDYPLPNPQDYDVSLKTGFLPEDLPLAELPEYFKPWEKIAKVIPALLLTHRVRSAIDKQVPLLSTANLKTEAEYRRAYSVLGFLAHAYIWGVSEPTNKLPESIAKPWIEVSDHLRLPPIGTYAGLCLWNYQPIFGDLHELLENGHENISDPSEFLDNIQTITTYTGSLDESWFYLVSVYFEYIVD